MNRWAKLILIGSMILNMLLLGVIVGRTPQQLNREELRQQRIDDVLKGAPSEVQTRLKEKFRQLRAAGEPQFKRIRTAQKEAVELLVAQPFDESAYDRKVNELNNLRMEATSNMSRVAKEITKDLTAEERQRFASMLQRPATTSR